MLTLTPSAGSVLGGTAVRVYCHGHDPCYNETDDIVCTFDGQKVRGVFVNGINAACVSPPLSRLGPVPFELIVRSNTGVVRVEGNEEFTSCKYMYIATTPPARIGTHL